MTREEFISRWRHKYVGLGCYGSCNQKLPVSDRDANVMRVVEEVEAVLGKQYDDLVPLEKELAKPTPANGQTGVKR